MEEVHRLVNQGYEEITLLGQNVNSWGLEKVGVGLRKMMLASEKFSLKDIPSNVSQYEKPTGVPPFVRLLQAVSAIPQIKVVRFLSANPWDFHDELIAEIGRNKKLIDSSISQSSLVATQCSKK
jgi:tRNA-2-methylthio-N6-dimethylallyladenosine synthase